MKNLRLKILLTNISRIVRSVIFINLSTIVLGMNKIFGAIDINNLEPMEPLCYAKQDVIIPIQLTIFDKIVYFLEENIFILLVPIVLIIITIIFATKKIKEYKKINEEVKRRMEEKNDKQN